ncbi:MAG: hypothetical protein PHY09_07740 [Desulfuromonadaceae bacterium]|nr:hypothetical protein [Desulfuromonadaceae bacterium]MDD5106816.1 hypothetical protein [Desulfuromonadaceae bacterium]
MLTHFFVADYMFRILPWSKSDNLLFQHQCRYMLLIISDVWLIPSYTTVLPIMTAFFADILFTL